MSESGEFTMRYADCPPSMNNARSGYKSHWTAGHKAKRLWQSTFEDLMMVHWNDLGRGRADRVEVQATLTFPDRRRRDADNYRMILSKALGDAFVTTRVIPDDTPEHYELTHLRFGHGPMETVLRVRWETL
jgi:Holliday junction resolvase RusA-like endonuclease